MITSRTTEHPQPGGFTLIELLVVVSIIALLIAILLPTARGARDAACAVTCGAQSKQIALAAVLYTGDFDNTFPIGDLGGDNPSGGAHNAVLGKIRPEDEDLYRRGKIRHITPYTNESDEVFECCADHGKRPGYPHFNDGLSMYDASGTSYSFNGGAWQIDNITIPMPNTLAYPLDFHDWGLWGRNIDNMPDPSKMVLIGEWSFYWLISQEWPGGGFTDWGDGRFFVFHGELGPTPDFDKVRMNHTFVDGHGEFQTLHHKRTSADEHYFNEDYEYAQPPLH